MKNNIKPSAELMIHGIGVFRGIAIGPAFIVEYRHIVVPQRKLAQKEIEAEVQRLYEGVARTDRQLEILTRKARAAKNTEEDVTLLIAAYRGMLSGSRLVRGIEDVLRLQRLNAEAATDYHVCVLAKRFAAMDDEYLAMRADDVREIGNRLIRNLMHDHYNPFSAAPVGSIMIAENITPADTALMEPGRVAGFVTELGGAEGHTAIMARALGLPAVLGLPQLLDNVVAGDAIIVDGINGDVIVRPNATTLAKYRREAGRINRETAKLQSTFRDLPSLTADGVAVRLEANLELPREVDAAVSVGADGIGLLRTEFMFMNRPDLPNEDEQYESLVSILQRLDGRLLTVRTLDVGGEKLAPALGNRIVVGANPALGLRAVRLSLREPELLNTQLAAFIRAAVHGPLRILVPMVSSLSQMRRVREHMEAVRLDLQKRGVAVPAVCPPLGAMIEIPAAAMMADALSGVCDFFAIGSNDLTQYTLAIDRSDEQVADLYDPFHPAVLKLISLAIAAGKQAGIPVSLCGEMAGDPRATKLLLGLGLREFSMAPSRLLEMKKRMLSVTVSKAETFAASVMKLGDEETIDSMLVSV